MNWVDFTVIAATALVFATVVAVNNPHAARARDSSTLILASDLPMQTSQLPASTGLIKAKIGLSTSRP